MKLWHFGNTSVRSPFRLRDGLMALASSSLQGNLYGKKQEIAFRDLLGEYGVVKLGKDDTYSVSRKWRSALDKLGFIFPKLKGEEAEFQDNLGASGAITENGRRLIDTDSVSGWQECYLRSLAAMFIPNGDHLFSPLRHTLATMVELEKRTADSALTFLEIALLVQRVPGEDSPSDVAKKVIAFREKREAAEKKKVYDREQTEAASERFGKKFGTFSDYADTNIRYLKATGLVQRKGRGISLVPDKRVLVSKLILDTRIPESPLGRYQTLCAGAPLPTDEKDSALAVLYDLVERLNERGHFYDLTAKKLGTPQDIAIVRHEIEDILTQLKEEEYASIQTSMGEEISEFIGLLMSTKKNKTKTLSNGEQIKIPRGEAPAYFEWIIWRAFLAIDSLVNKPWEARRFKVDQDFLPVGVAPRSGPDIIFEFSDMVLVVEVTLTSSSRQEAAEGEPVRRHVAKYAEDFEGTKPVFGLFLAVNIDTNTANSFRLGEWYLKDDRKINLHIVPMALEDFKAVWDASADDASQILPKLKDLLRNCRMYSNEAAPEWKEKVSDLTQKAATSLKQ